MSAGYGYSATVYEGLSPNGAIKDGNMLVQANGAPGVSFDISQIISHVSNADGSVKITFGETGDTDNESLTFGAKPTSGVYYGYNTGGDFVLITDANGSIAIPFEDIEWTATPEGESLTTSGTGITWLNGGGVITSSRYGFGQANIRDAIFLALEERNALNIEGTPALLQTAEAVATGWTDIDYQWTGSGGSGGSTSGAPSGGTIAASPTPPNPPNYINGSAGGDIYDVAGTNIIGLGYVAATVHATLGTDMIYASTTYALDATGNANPLSIYDSGGRGTIIAGSGALTYNLSYQGIPTSNAQTMITGTTNNQAGDLTINDTSYSVGPTIHVVQYGHIKVTASFATIYISVNGTDAIDIIGADSVDRYTFSTLNLAGNVVISTDQYKVTTVTFDGSANFVPIVLGVDPTIIDGTAGGDIYDAAGKNIINLGATSSYVHESHGADTVNLGTGNAIIDASQNPNPTTVQITSAMSSGSTQFRGGAGSASLSVGSGALSVVGGSGSISINSLISSSNSVTISAGQGTITASNVRSLLTGFDGLETANIGYQYLLTVTTDVATGSTTARDAIGDVWKLLGGAVTYTPYAPYSPPPPPPPTSYLALTGPTSISVPKHRRVTLPGETLTGGQTQNNDVNITLTVSVTNGIVTLVDGDGDDVSGSGTHSITVQGSIGTLNTYLKTIGYISDASGSPDSLTISVIDSTGDHQSSAIPITTGATHLTYLGAASSPGSDTINSQLPYSSNPGATGGFNGFEVDGGIEATSTMIISNPIQGYQVVGSITLNVNTSNLMTQEDTKFQLTSPDGTVATLDLANAIASTGTTTLNPATGNAVASGNVAIKTDAFIGTSNNGTWTLTVSDAAGSSAGFVDAWGLSINGQSASPVIFTSAYGSESDSTDHNINNNNIIYLVNVTGPTEINGDTGVANINGVDTQFTNKIIGRINAEGTDSSLTVSSANVDIIGGRGDTILDNSDLNNGNSSTIISSNSSVEVFFGDVNATDTTNATHPYGVTGMSPGLSVVRGQGNVVIKGSNISLRDPSSANDEFYGLGTTGHTEAVVTHGETFLTEYEYNPDRDSINYVGFTDDDYMRSYTFNTPTGIDVEFFDDTPQMKIINNVSLNYSAGSIPGQRTDSQGLVLDYGSGSINSGDQNATILASSSTSQVHAGNGDNIIIASTGSENISVGLGTNEIHLEREAVGSSDTISAAGATKLTAGSGSVQFTGGEGRDTITAGSGAGNYTLGSGTSIVVGNGGPLTVDGGSGTATITGGASTINIITAGTAGNSSITAGTGQATLTGRADGDHLTAAGSQSDTLIAGNGAETLSAGTSTAHNTFIGGAGTTTMVSGLGGSAMTAGTGTDHFVFQAGATGGSSNTITGFKIGVDDIDLGGTWPTDVTEEEATAWNGRTTDGENGTLLTLSDGTTIDMVGISPATVAGPWTRQPIVVMGSNDSTSSIAASDPGKSGVVYDGAALERINEALGNNIMSTPTTTRNVAVPIAIQNAIDGTVTISAATVSGYVEIFDEDSGNIFTVANSLDIPGMPASGSFILERDGVATNLGTTTSLAGAGNANLDFFASTSSSTNFTAGSNPIVIDAGDAGGTFTMSSSKTTFLGGAGRVVFNGGSGETYIHDGNGSNYAAPNPWDYDGPWDPTVFYTGVYNLGSGLTTFIGDAGHSIVDGGSGTSNITAGSGGIEATAGTDGNSMLMTGIDLNTHYGIDLTGSANGDTLIANGPGDYSLSANGGDEVLSSVDCSSSASIYMDAEHDDNSIITFDVGGMANSGISSSSLSENHVILHNTGENQTGTTYISYVNYDYSHPDSDGNSPATYVKFDITTEGFSIGNTQELDYMFNHQTTDGYGLILNATNGSKIYLLHASPSEYTHPNHTAPISLSDDGGVHKIVYY